MAALVCVDSAWAGETKVEASLSQEGVWDSNPLLRVDNIMELFGSTTTPKLKIVNQTQTTDLTLTTWLDHNMFNLEEFNSTDLHGQLGLVKRTERLEVGLTASGDYDTTRTSELTNLGLESEAVRHLKYSATPSLRYALSQISSVQLSGDYTKSSYDGGGNTDYHILSLSPSYQRNFTERYAGVVSLNARRYETDEGVERVVDSIGPSIGVLAKITDQWSGDFRVGQEASREELAGADVNGWSWSSVYAANLRFEGEQDTFLLSSTRAQQPYNNGTDLLLTSVAIKGARKINPLFSVNAGLSYQFSDSDQTNGSRLDTLYTGNAGLTYHVTETLGLSTSYRYKQETFKTNDETAKQNIVRLGLTYKPRFESLW